MFGLTLDVLDYCIQFSEYIDLTALVSTCKRLAN